MSEYMTPGEVSRIFRVDPKTVTRWAVSERLPSIRTPGGHRRIPRQAVTDMINRSAIGHIPDLATDSTEPRD